MFAFAICSSFCQRFCVFISRYTICVYHDYHEIVYHDVSSIMIIVASLISSLSVFLSPAVVVYTDQKSDTVVVHELLFVDF